MASFYNLTPTRALRVKQLAEQTYARAFIEFEIDSWSTLNFVPSFGLNKFLSDYRRLIIEHYRQALLDYARKVIAYAVQNDAPAPSSTFGTAI